MKSSLLFLAPILLIAGCTHKKSKPDTKSVVEAAKQEAKSEREGFSGIKSVVGSGGELSGGDAQGRPLWKLSAKTIRASGNTLGPETEAGKTAKNAPQTATLLEARATLYRAGKAETTLSAPQIVVFYLPGGVRLQLSKGVKGSTLGPWTKNRGAVKIAAPRADVDVKKRVISASGGVSMNQGTLQVHGQTLRAETSLQTAEMKGRVRAKDTQKGKIGGEIEAQSALYDWQKNQVSARQVVALQGGTRLSGQVLSADTRATRGTLTGQVRAQSAQGQASAPRVDFDWGKDQITAREASFSGSGGTLRAASLVTDSKLRLANATNLVASQNGATLRAAFADGFDGLNRLRGREVNYNRGDLSFFAPRADARKSGDKWILVAQGGARGQNASGQVRASQVTWDETRNRVLASGNVVLSKDGATLRGQTLDSDAKFQNATLKGQVRGAMKDGSTLEAKELEKRGETFFARSGATAHLKSRGTLGALTLRGAQIEARADGSSAVATGGVTMTSSTGATASAPRATYTRKTNKVVATGGVDFFDPVRGLRSHGDTLVADLKLNSATLTYAQGQGNSRLLEGLKFP
ncbi:Lipopolysaccharide-assembly, LptC-related [Abditibacterium utsteinense]|uniref:Lipopolysaccharide-assembly, LptC-related n=1 Tax=Abditibacterium utsteinense TaxID=1960156 RepID=A0A2S8SUX4_9BACT|nr:LPS export ABC transporter periplasmic protein LptC [Abditibacterium utsteinense]PQV64586.1 Lipopolysaccharide-assembly, LptC-related [Abditibacterium utsteinense]